MNFTATWFPFSWLLVADVILALLLFACAKPAWQALNLHKRSVGIALIILAVSWSLRAGLNEGELTGINYHLLGISLVTLMLSAPLALWLSSILVIVYTLTLQDASALQVSALNILAAILPAIVVCHSLRVLCQKKLPHNIFIYIFVNGFAAAALGMISTGVVIIILLQLAGVYQADVLWSSVFPLFFLLSFGEAFITGLLTAVFVALAPHLLSTFNDQHYLQSQNKIWKP